MDGMTTQHLRLGLRQLSSAEPSRGTPPRPTGLRQSRGFSAGVQSMATVVQLHGTAAAPSLLSNRSKFLNRGENLQQKNNAVITRFGRRLQSRATLRSTLRFNDLQADDFRHPLDRQNTTLLRTIPGLAEIGKFLLGSSAEELMILENISTSVLVGEDQLADLHKLMVNAANILDLDPPDLYVRQNPVPNAYTLAVSGRKPFVVIHTSLVELLTPEELQAVIAHELGHLKCDHGIWLSFANILALGAYSLPGLGALLARNLEEQLMRWVRAAELTCDRAALLVAQDPEVVISVLMKLAGGCRSLSGQLSVSAFLKQARSYEKASQSLLGWYLRNAQAKQLSHPLPVLRALEIDQWSRSPEYRALIAQASPASSRWRNHSSKQSLHR